LDESRFVVFLLWFVCAWSSIANYALIWNKRELFWLALLKPIFVNKDIIWALAYLHQHIFFALCIILTKTSNEFVNACNWFHRLHGDALLKLNNCQNWKIYILFSFLNFSPLAKFGNMEPIHVKESFKIFMNESGGENWGKLL